ncbi:Uncharacterised protein [Sphingobacterium thalpophilum]|uniref:Uncharacterized protein n=1 Tax=Sphingobacterium thalpophilum TaxID=259 RepID=A0A4U9UYR7_9SPHI|nr:Uncharacterised protein [Sphingobacterium thalpophilum]
MSPVSPASTDTLFLKPKGKYIGSRAARANINKGPYLNFSALNADGNAPILIVHSTVFYCNSRLSGRPMTNWAPIQLLFL